MGTTSILVIYTVGAVAGGFLGFQLAKVIQSVRYLKEHGSILKNTYRELQEAILLNSIKTASGIFPETEEMAERMGVETGLQRYVDGNKRYEREIEEIERQAKEKLSPWPEDPTIADGILKEMVLDIIESIKCHSNLQDHLWNRIHNEFPEVRRDEIMPNLSKIVEVLQEHVQVLDWEELNKRDTKHPLIHETSDKA